MAPPREKPSEALLQFAEGRCQQNINNPNVADRETVSDETQDETKRANTFFSLGMAHTGRPSIALIPLDHSIAKL